jgi:acetoin utilization deacetylase AcuC-like enzyme
VHHGNGTQAVFYDDPNVLFISMHRGSLLCERRGSADFFGEGAGLGYNINLPLELGDGDIVVQEYQNHIVGPVISQFQPDVIVVSLGYDALDVSKARDSGLYHAPGLDCAFSPQIFGWLTRKMTQLCRKVVLHSEGGYEPVQCGEASVICVKALLGDPIPPPRTDPPRPPCLTRRIK